MFGRVEKFVWWNRLGLKLSAASDAVAKEIEMEAEKPQDAPKYDFKKTLAKALLALVIAVGAMVLGDVLTTLTNSGFVTGKLESAGLSHTVAVTVSGVIVFLATAARNYWKHKNLGKETEQL